MKRIFLIIMILLLCRSVYPQTIYPIRADTVRIYTGSTAPGAGGELLLQNGSMGVVNGLLTNTNFRGNTVFRKLVLNYTPNNITGGLIGITGQDTIQIPGLKPYMDTMYLSGGNLLYQKNGNTYTVVLPTSPVITANNFLTKTGNNIQLGGNAVTNTTLSALLTNFKITGTDNAGGTSVFELNGSLSTGFQEVVNRGTTASGFNNFYNTFDINSGTVGGTNSLIRATPTLALMQLSTPTLNTNFAISTGANTFTDGINSRGISYGNNYAQNNGVNDRWLPDKRYVDSVVTGAGGGVPFVGKTYEKTTWTNLSDFAVNTVGATVSAGKILIPDAGVMDFSKSLELASYSCINHWKAEMIFTLTAPISPTTTGISLGIQSTNVNSLNSWAVYFRAADDNPGRMEFFSQSNSGSWVTNGAAPSNLDFDQNDRVKLSIERDNNLVYIRAENLSDQTAAPVNYTVTTDLNSDPIAPNTGHFALWGQGGTYQVESFVIYNKEIANPDIMFVGDSKTLGYSATSFYKTYPGLLGNQYKNVAISAGFGDKTTDLENHLPEIIQTNPKAVMLSIGANDERFGGGPATTFEVYQRIVDTLHVHGIAVYHLSPAYETGLDLSEYYFLIRNAYQGVEPFIDIFDMFQENGNLAPDGIHWTDQGDYMVAKVVLDSNYIQAVKTDQQFTDLTPNNIYTTDGTLTGDRIVSLGDHNLTFQDDDISLDQSRFVFSRNGPDVLLKSNYYFGDISQSENAEAAVNLSYSQYGISGGGRFYSSGLTGDSALMYMSASQIERKLVGFQYTTVNFFRLDTSGVLMGRDRNISIPHDTVNLMRVDTLGVVTLPHYKNNATGDSILTVDQNGKIILALPNTGLMRPLRITTTTTTLTIQEYYLNCNNTTDIIVNLPAPSLAISGKSYIIKKVSANTNTVTINPGVGVTIDGDPNVVMSSFRDYVIIYTDGVNWWLSSQPL